MGNTTKTKILLACGAIGCPLFIIVFLIEGATRVGYNPLRHPISSLSIGEWGWVQAANFIITGLSIIAFAVGLRNILRKQGGKMREPLLITIVGIGLCGAGICTTDPVYGYPANMPLAIAQFTIRGHLHDLFSIPVFACLPAACFIYRHRFIQEGKRGWAAYSVFTAVAMLITFVLAGIGFKQVPGFVNFAGVFQRLSIIIGWAWITLLAIHLLRGKRFNMNKL